MSDFFMPTQKNNYSVQNENENENRKRKSIFTSDSMLTTDEEFQQQKQQRLANRQRYGVTVPDQIYEVFNQMCARCSTPEEANELSYKLGSACRYMEMAGDTWDNFQNYFDDVDNLNAAQFPNLQDQKSRFEALSDSLQIGKNNVELGELGQKLMKAHKENDTELADSLMAEINAINQQNVLLQDNVPRHFIMQELEAGAQSLPFTGAAAAAGVFGNFIAPGAGTAASFAVSSYLAAGSEYVDMIANGSTPETARTMAMLTGGIEGIIEANLGITKGIVKGSARLMGKEVAESFAQKKLKEIESKVLKNVHFGTFKRNVINYLERRGGDILGEGMEEFWQENTSILGKEIAAALDGYDIPDDDIKSIVKQTTQAFKGGVLGALGLGLIPGMNPARLEAYADFANVKIVRDAAENIDSEEVFKNTVKDNPIFKDMPKEQKDNDLHEIWQNAQQRKEEKADIEARKIAEGLDAGEGAEQRKTTTDENGNVIEDTADPVARDEAGRLITADEVYHDDNGKETGGTFRVGDTSKSKEEGNRYGYIRYEINENGDITITDFKMNSQRQGLRAEVFEEFAREHPDVNIEWNAIGSEWQDVKQELIKNNPSGAKNGLRYFTTADIDDIATRKSLFSEIRENVHNYKPVKYFDENNQAKIRYEQSELTNEQLATAVEVIELRAKHVGLSITDYMNKRFKDGKLFGNPADIAKSALAQKQNSDTINGGIKPGKARENWQKDGMYIKGVIYAAQNADFATLIHELSHGFRAELTGQELADAEAAFDVKDGDWDALSKYKGPDGEFLTKEEAFAYFGQDYFITGKAPTPQMENIFKRLAKYLAEALSRLSKHLEFSPEIAKVFNNLLANDDSVYNKALKAAQEEEGEYRAMLKRDAEAKEAQKKAEAEQAKKQAEAEREEAAEGTDFAENAPTAEDLLKGIEEAENETKENQGETNAIDNALKDLPLTDEQKAEAAEVLKDETSTRVEKAETVTEAAASVYDEVTTPEDNEEKSNSILNGEPVHEIKSAELNIDKNNMKESGIEYIRNNPQGIAKTNIGDIEITEKGVKQSLSHTLSLLKVYAIPAIKDVLEKGTYLGVIKDLDGKRQNNYYFAAPITIDDKKEILFIRVKHVAGRNKVFYVHDIFTEQEINEAGPYSGEPIENRRSLRGAALAKSIIQDYEKYNKIQNDKMYFQKAYHGSGADFDKFDTENYGFSGEGSMSFGYGTYVTDSEDIARDYADRQVSQKYQNVDDPYNVLKTNIIATIIHDTEIKGFEKALKERIEFLQKRIENSQGLYTEEQVENSKEVLDEIKNYTEEDLKKRRLYTVEIPDDGYLDWEKEYNAEDLAKIKEAMKTVSPDENAQTNVNKWHFANPKKNTLNGATVYETIANYLGSPEAASKFLHSIGYAGIKYPAGTIHGNGNGAYNYVIFNDDDAQIVDKLLFQTQAELMDEARTFETWQEFMEYCELFYSDDEVSPIPGDSDAQWYQSFWEQAKGVQTEQEKNEQAVVTKKEKEGNLPLAVDALFSTYIKSYPEMVDNFLNAVAEIDAIDLDSEEWQQAQSAEDAAQRDKIDQLKDFINITLSDYNWQTALKRIQGGHEISEGLRKRLIGEMTDSFKARDFRALYAEVMNDEQYAVAPEDSITATLNKKLRKYHDIVKPNDDISRWSPERRKQLAEQLQNREIAAKIKNGSLKLDDELDAYIKSLNAQIKEKQKQFDELEAETKADYQRIADKEKRDLLKLHEQLLLARGKLKTRNQEVERKIAKGLKITDKYSRITQNLNADYDEIFRKYSDLRNTITINAEVQAALDRQEQVAGLKDDLNAKQKEKNLTAEVKKMRIQLVKRAMRRVPFNRIDFNNARTVIAIQRMLEPNLLGGVNRFIGIDSAYLRGIISQIVTDSEYKEKIMNYLSKNTKASQAFADFKKKIEELKSVKDFDSWTAKERKAAIRYLPKENWVRDLNLMQLAKEREESIDLDIGMEEVKRPVYDEKTGEIKTYRDSDGTEHNVTETAFRVKFDDELGRLVQDAVGADMFDKIVNMPFSEWTTEDLETLAQRIDEIYTEGRELKAAKDEARKREANAIRMRIENAIKETGITINDDDTPEEKERKQKQNNKIMGMSSDLKGTEAGKTKGFMAKLNRLLHSYDDMNVLRFARMLDGQSEGENVRMLYRKEDDCYIAKQRSMDSRATAINKVMADNKITEGDLAKSIKVDSLNTEFTVDELLYFLAADKDYVEDEKKLQKGDIGLDANDDYAATSRNAVMFGNMMSDAFSQEEKENWLQMDKDMEEALQNDTLTQEQKEALAIGQLDKKPGTTQYIAVCHAKWATVLQVANQFLEENPKYKALMEAIEADYASQYERMNEVSITEFNQPVHRVKAYVPLVRRESNGDTNENRVREDLLGASGVGKQWADKGMTQRRVNIGPLHQKPVQTGLFRTWGDSIERTEHFIAYAPYVRQLNAIYKSRDAAYTRRFIESRYGKGAIEYLDSYINEVANPNAGRIRERGAEWLHILRGKTAPAYLGWKASGIIKQGLTSPWPYMQFVNPAEYLSAAMKFTFNPEMRDAISKKSIYMKLRRMDPVNDLIDEMAENAKGKVDRAWSKFSQIGMQGLEMIDWACVAPGWLACYEKKYNQLQKASEARYNAKMAELKERNIYAEVGTSEYLTPEQMEAQARKEMTEDIETEAVRYADDCTRACQPSNRVTDLAPLFKNSSEAMKAFLQFQTSLNVIWQNIRYDLPYAVKQKEFKRIAGTVIGYVCAGIFMNSVMDGVRGDDDDDDMQALRNLIYYSTTQFTDAIPIMGSEITNVMDKVITGKRAYSQSGTDMTPSATKLLNALQKVTSGNYKKAASLTAEGIGLFMGAPVSGVKEINKLLGKPLSEGEINIKKGVGDVYGAVGDILDE